MYLSLWFIYVGSDRKITDVRLLGFIHFPPLLNVRDIMITSAQVVD